MFESIQIRIYHLHFIKLSIALSISRSGTSFLATEQPFQDVRKENRREVGGYFFTTFLYFECINSTANVEYVSSM